MNYKYANLLTIMWVTMFYGSGMPILYFVAALYYFATYWVDKILIFYYYKKPELLDEDLSRRAALWYKYALLLHLLGAVFMYSNSAILPDKDILNTKKFGKAIKFYVHLFSWGTVTSVHVSLYIGFCIAIAATYIIWKLIISNIIICVKKYCLK